MLPRKYRLTADKDIDRVFKKGRGMNVPGFGVKCAKNGKDLTRFAFVVGTKASKKAVIRNRLKRQMREVVHAMLPEIAPGYDVVITARKEAVDSEFGHIKGVLEKILRKCGIIAVKAL